MQVRCRIVLEYCYLDPKRVRMRIAGGLVLGSAVLAPEVGG